MRVLETRSAVKIASIREDSFFALLSTARYFITGRIITLQIFVFFLQLRWQNAKDLSRPFVWSCVDSCRGNYAVSLHCFIYKRHAGCPRWNKMPRYCLQWGGGLKPKKDSWLNGFRTNLVRKFTGLVQISGSKIQGFFYTIFPKQ